MKEEAARWGTGIDHVGEALELDPLVVEFANQLNQASFVLYECPISLSVRFFPFRELAPSILRFESGF